MMEHSRKGEVTVSESDYLAKEEVLRRLSELKVTMSCTPPWSA
jgi:hypothetical protein